MEVTLEVTLLDYEDYFRDVSILILMEVTLEGEKQAIIKSNKSRFNPYSNGSYSGSYVL